LCLSVCFNCKNKIIVFYRCLVIALIALSIFSMRYGLDVAINGFDRKEKLKAAKEKYAHEMYKPSVRGTTASYIGLSLNKKGYKFTEIINLRWFKSSFQSFVGRYGRTMQIRSPSVYYKMMLFVYLVVFFYLSFMCFNKGSFEIKVLFSVSLLFMLLNLAASIYYSWTSDNQPQGRYLFPIIPILFLVLARCRHLLHRNVLLSAFVILFVLSLVSCQS